MRPEILLLAALCTSLELRAEAPVNSSIRVHLPKNGVVSIDGKAVALEQCRIVLAEAGNRDKTTVIRITCVDGISHAWILTICDFCRAAGLERVTIETVLETKPNSTRARVL